MNLTIAGHGGFDLTKALKQHTQDIFTVLYRELKSLVTARVVLEKISGAKNPVEKFAVSAVVNAGKNHTIIKKIECEASKMYEAIERLAAAVRKIFLARKRKLNSKKTVSSGVTEFATKLNRRVASTGFFHRGIDRRRILA